MRNARALLQDALALPEAERAEIALGLVSSLDGDASTDVDQAWAAEVSERLGRLARGEVATRPADEAMRDARTWLLSRRA